jgi:hypothetical protein
MMANNHVHAGFVRNRRFLVAVSVGLACVKLLDLNFTQVSVLGNQAVIHNQALVGVLEWILLGWALAQYTVWFNDVGAARELREAITDHCERSLGERVAREPIPKRIKAAAFQDLVNQEPAVAALPAEQLKFQPTYKEMHGDGLNRDRAADIEAVAFFRLPEQRGEFHSARHRFERVITPEEWDSQWKVSRRAVLFRSRFLLEYFAPFCLALLPIVITAGPILIRAVHQFTALR